MRFVNNTPPSRTQLTAFAAGIYAPLRPSDKRPKVLFVLYAEIMAVKSLSYDQGLGNRGFANMPRRQSAPCSRKITSVSDASTPNWPQKASNVLKQALKNRPIQPFGEAA